MIDLDRARNETSGCKNVLHFNNAGAALMPDIVVETVQAHLKLEQEIGGYEAEDKREEDLNSFYHGVAGLLNCASSEIAFIENATRAWDMAFYSLNFQANDKILTSVSEYASNYIAFLQIARRTGATIDVIPNDESGQLCIAALEERIDRRTKLIAITHVPTNGGLVNPAAEVGRVAKKAGVTYLLDACQSVGQMVIDVQQIGCDILSCTGRKFLRGPRGTGFLYIRNELLENIEPIFLDLHAAQWTSANSYTMRNDARRFETWECSYASKLGLIAAIEYARGWGMENIELRIKALAEQLRLQLASMCGVSVHDIGAQKCGIVTFSMEGLSPDEIHLALRERAINVSTSSSKGTRLDMEARGLASIVRASVHYYNSEQEIDAFCTALGALSL